MCAAPQVQFCLDWADNVLRTTCSMRRRRNQALGSVVWRNLSSLSSSASISPAATPAAARLVHELVDMSMVARAEKAREEQTKRGRKTKSNQLSISKGKCAHEGCPTHVEGYAGPLPARTTTRCVGCKDGKGAFMHLPCFFDSHSCVSGSKSSSLNPTTPGS